MEKLGFYLVFGAFLIGAMERHLEARGRNDGEGDNSPLVAACFGGVFLLMMASSVFLAGSLAAQSTLSTAFSLFCVFLLALALNKIAGGVDLLPEMHGRLMSRLEEHETALRSRVIPLSYAIAFIGLAYETFLVFALR